MMTSTRVLMLTQFLGIGGLERMILNLSLSLKKYTDWQPEVFAYDQSYHDTMDAYMDDVFRKQGIPVHGCRKKSGFSWSVVEKIARHCRTDSIPVIHTHDLGALIYGALVKLRLFGRIRLVHTQHSFVHLSRHFRYRLYERFFTLFADQIIVVSPDTKQRYVDLGVKASKIQIIPNGVEFSEVSPSEESQDSRLKKRREAIQDSVAPDTSKEQLRRYQDQIWILYLARIHAGKGQDKALELWNALKPEDRAKAVMIFIGPETLTGELDRLKNNISKSIDSDRLIYAGPTQFPSLWISASDLFMSSSEFEGMPLAPNEALGSGLPTILSDIPGHENLQGLAVMYPLAEPAQGAGKLSQMLQKFQANRDQYLRETWLIGQPIRDRLSTKAMALSYITSYQARAFFS